MQNLALHQDGGTTRRVTHAPPWTAKRRVPPSRRRDRHERGRESRESWHRLPLGSRPVALRARTGLSTPMHHCFVAIKTPSRSAVFNKRPVIVNHEMTETTITDHFVTFMVLAAVARGQHE